MLLHRSYIALGSNLGDRRNYLEQALGQIDERESISVVQVSPIIETTPVGPVKQGNFLNAVAEVATDLDAFALLDELLRIETRLGRIRREKWGPRTIDLDILLYDDLIIDDARLSVPHPHLVERVFALEPLASIAPDLIHPVIGTTIAEILLEYREGCISRSCAASLPNG